MPLLDEKLLARVARFGNKYRRMKRWQKIVSALACVVVFCTTYALILPAITMEKTSYCGYEEHVHTDECYEVKLLCETASTTSIEHTHTESCYTKESTLVCTLEETEGHTHSDACIHTEQVLSCNTEESEGHTHSDACYENTEHYVCGLEEDPEHVHDDSCIQVESNLVCGQEESAGHTHTSECYIINESYVCGQEESEGHTHSEDCYVEESVLNCDLEEEVIEEHVHTAECYETVLVCAKEEHEHSLACYSDATADVESAANWENTLPKELSGVWADDVIAVAKSQLGYEESTRNYIVTDEGKTKGYSRYGAWYGDPYGHWCAMFASFCLHYADVDTSLIPLDCSCQNWIETLSKEKYDLYRTADTYIPVPGDLIFFDNDQTDNQVRSNHVGIVVELIAEDGENINQVKTIEGNASNMVKYCTYNLTDSHILGYAVLPENPEMVEEEVTDEAVLEEEQEAESDENTDELKTLTLEEDWITATATFTDGVLPEDAVINVAYVDENSDVLYENLEDYVSEQGKSVVNTYFLSVVFTDAEGNEIEPDGEVTIKFTFNNPIEAQPAVMALALTDDESEDDASTEWNLYYIDGENTVTDSQTSTTLETGENNTLQSVSTTYQSGMVYAVSATAEDGTEDDTTEDDGTETDSWAIPTDLTGDWITDFVTIANSQLGYTEGTDGYTKYGEWYGNSNGDWEAMFVSYCLYYAGVDTDIVPINSDCQSWMNVLASGRYDLYEERVRGSNTAQVGDIVFAINSNGKLVVGVIIEITGTAWNPNIIAIQGNVTENGVDCVATYQYTDYLYNSNVKGFVTLPLKDDKKVLKNTFAIGDTGDTTGTATVVLDASQIDDNASLMVTVEESTDLLKALEKYLEKVGTENPINYILTIELQNVDVDSEDVYVTIEFAEPIEALLSSGEKGLETEWVMNYITSDGTITSAAETNNVVFEMDDSDLLSSMEFIYEDKEYYAISAIVVDPNATEVEVDSFEELVEAINKISNVKITLKDSFTADASIVIGTNQFVSIDLNGNTITSTGTLFNVNGGSLTITDSQTPTETVTSQGNVDADDAGDNMASYNKNTKKLTYYVTESTVINTGTGATQETLYKHTVTLEGMLKGSSSPIITISSGTVNVDGGAIVECTNSAISQTGGTLNLNSGYICGNSTAGSGGAVYSQGNGTIIVNGTVLAGNTAGVDGGAIAINASTLIINDGIISGNKSASSGGGVFTNGYTNVTINDGYITNNKSESTDYYSGGAGIYTTGQNTLTINGGYITGNYAGGGGGGVRAGSTTIVITGGMINANYAYKAEGGGLSIDQPAVATISGGYFNNNVSYTHEHWGGGGIFCANDSTLYMTCVLLTENEAGGYGGGVAGCSTGRTFICEHNGGAIYNNKASEYGEENLSGSESAKNEDHIYATEIFKQYGYDDYFSAFNSVVGGTMLGGEPAYWYGSVDGVPVNATGEDTLISTYLMGLTSHPTAVGIAQAQEEANVYVNGNESYTHGGGILCNGYMVIGDVVKVEIYSRLQVHATKALVDENGDALALTEGQFEFVIESADTGIEVATGTNDANGNIVFDHMIPFTEEGTYVYRVYEKQDTDNTGILMDTAEYQITVTVERKRMENLGVHIKKYQYQITNIKIEKNNGDGWELVREVTNPENKDQYPVSINLTESNATFTNFKVDATKFSVIKRWEGEPPTEGTVIKVQLFQNGTAYGDPVKLSESNSWSYDWGELPLTATVDGETVYYTYTVEELEIPTGYQVEYETNSISKQQNIWVPVSGSSLVSGGKYIIVSPDGEHVLYPSSTGQHIITENDQMTVKPVTKAIESGGVTYNNYYLAAAIADNSIFTASNGCLKSECIGWCVLGINRDSEALQWGWDKVVPLYVGDMQIYTGSYSSDTQYEQYAVVYENGSFAAVNKEYAGDNATKLYMPITTEAINKVVFTITNTKYNEDDITYSLDVTKVSGSDENMLLSGAYFELLKADADGKEITGEDGNPVAVTFTKVTAGKYEYCSSSTGDDVTELVTAFGGKLVLTELPAGNYILRETQAPNGYLLAEDQKITLGDGSSTSIKLTIEDERDEEKFYELPETGGTGTSGYTAGGVLLILLAACMLFLKQKNQKKGGYHSNGS